MPMATIQQLISNGLGMRTGNPMLDAMLVAAMFAMFNVLSTKLEQLRSAMAKRTRIWRWGRNVTCLHVPRVVRVNIDYGNCYDAENRDYTALSWYLARRAPIKDGHALVASTVLTTDRLRGTDRPTKHTIILPEGDQAVEFEHEGHTVTYARAYIEREREDKIVVIQKERIELRMIRMNNRTKNNGTPMRALLDIVESARVEYDAHIKAVQWTQMMYRLTPPSGDKDGGLKWTGSPTHSGDKNFDTIVLDASVKADLVQDLSTFLAGEAWYARMGLSYKRGYLLHGPPGTGKTSIVLALAGIARADIYHLNLAQLTTDEALDKAFHDMPPRCVVVFDDIDAMGRVVHDRRNKGDVVLPANAFDANAFSASAFVAMGRMQHVSSDDPMPSRLTLGCLLNHLDGVGCNHGRIFVMTTNHPERLDPAIVRPGRADLTLELGPCSSYQLRTFVELFASLENEKGKENEPSITCSEYAETLDAIPSGVLTPAEVSSALLQFRGDLGRGVRRLAELAARKMNV